MLKGDKCSKYLWISHFEAVLHIVFELGLKFGQRHSLQTQTVVFNITHTHPSPDSCSTSKNYRLCKEVVVKAQSHLSLMYSRAKNKPRCCL